MNIIRLPVLPYRQKDPSIFYLKFCISKKELHPLLCSLERTEQKESQYSPERAHKNNACPFSTGMARIMWQKVLCILLSREVSL